MRGCIVKTFFLFTLLIFGASRAFAFIQAGTIQAGTIYESAAAGGATNSLLLEDGFYLLHENSDTMALES